LGYQDTSSFYRAFREWEGVTPVRWRELNAHARPLDVDPPSSVH
jgi:AraC-like DNA-binding protein